MVKKLHLFDHLKKKKTCCGWRVRIIVERVESPLNFLFAVSLSSGKWIDTYRVI